MVKFSRWPHPSLTFERKSADICIAIQVQGHGRRRFPEGSHDRVGMLPTRPISTRFAAPGIVWDRRKANRGVAAGQLSDSLQVSGSIFLRTNERPICQLA
jgi:hypothetical protein